MGARGRVRRGGRAGARGRGPAAEADAAPEVDESQAAERRLSRPRGPGLAAGSTPRLRPRPRDEPEPWQQRSPSSRRASSRPPSGDAVRDEATAPKGRRAERWRGYDCGRSQPSRRRSASAIRAPKKTRRSAFVSRAQADQAPSKARERARPAPRSPGNGVPPRPNKTTSSASTS